jgi:hypothetical protein
MIRTVSWVGCLLLVAVGAVVHGAATHRWSALTADTARSEAAHAHAVNFADYSCVIAPSELPVKENSRVTCRQYTSPAGRQPVTVSITSGPAGAVSTHTPDVCYPGSGYKMVKAPRKETIDLPGGGTASYLVAEFEKKTATTFDRHRIRWSWTADGGWEVPDHPRFAYLRVAFFNAPELYKLYVVTSVMPEDADRTDTDPPAVKSFVAAAFAQYAGLLSGK